MRKWHSWNITHMYLICSRANLCVASIHCLLCTTYTISLQMHLQDCGFTIKSDLCYHCRGEHLLWTYTWLPTLHLTNTFQVHNLNYFIALFESVISKKKYIYIFTVEVVCRNWIWNGELNISVMLKLLLHQSVRSYSPPPPHRDRSPHALFLPDIHSNALACRHPTYMTMAVVIEEMNTIFVS